MALISRGGARNSFSPFLKRTTMRLGFHIYNFVFKYVVAFLTPALATYPNDYIMKRAKFSFEFKTQGSRLCLVITDNRTAADSCMTVSQDMDAVLEYIAVHCRQRLENYVIVYRDTTGVWDGYDARLQHFVLLKEVSWDRAAARYIREMHMPQHQPQHA
jgi:hypothetical protein